LNTYIKMMIVTILLITSINTNLIAADNFITGSYNGILGKRDYKLYIPLSLDKNKKYPIVIMLHGCEQSAVDFAKGSRIIEWAERKKFMVLLPEQNPQYNSYKCWNWVLPINNTRTGEPEVIISMLDEVIRKYSGDQNRVFAAGMSAGGTMVSILGNCYPERFKALATHDGAQYYATSTGSDFSDVVLYGASVAPATAAQMGSNCSAFVRNRPKQMPIIIFHGMSGPLMSPAHAFQVEAEFKMFNDLLDNGVRDNSYYLEKSVTFVPATKTAYGYNKYVLINPNHEVLIERYMINDLSHSWSGGTKDMSYNDPKGPDATGFIMEFFDRYGLKD
jgi:poly(hydroxyalkanoate) depolymerase family esterase